MDDPLQNLMDGLGDIKLGCIFYVLLVLVVNIDSCNIMLKGYIVLVRFYLDLSNDGYH